MLIGNNVGAMWSATNCCSVRTLALIVLIVFLCRLIFGDRGDV